MPGGELCVKRIPQFNPAAPVAKVRFDSTASDESRAFHLAGRIR